MILDVDANTGNGECRSHVARLENDVIRVLAELRSLDEAWRVRFDNLMAAVREQGRIINDIADDIRDMR